MAMEDGFKIRFNGLQVMVFSPFGKHAFHYMQQRLLLAPFWINEKVKVKLKAFHF